MDLARVLGFINMVNTLKRAALKRILTRIERENSSMTAEDMVVVRKIILDGVNDLVRDIFSRSGYKIES